MVTVYVHVLLYISGFAGIESAPEGIVQLYEVFPFPGSIVYDHPSVFTVNHATLNGAAPLHGIASIVQVGQVAHSHTSQIVQLPPSIPQSLTSVPLVQICPHISFQPLQLAQNAHCPLIHSHNPQSDGSVQDVHSTHNGAFASNGAQDPGAPPHATSLEQAIPVVVHFPIQLILLPHSHIPSVVHSWHDRNSGLQ